MGKTESKPYYQIDSLVKGIRVIELLADQGRLSVSDVARRLGQNRSASHRFLATLKDEGYVKQDSHGSYSLSLKIFGLANKAMNHMEIRSMARPHMVTLVEKHKETVNLACLDGGNVIVIEMVKGLLPLKVDLPLGSRGPAHAAALGKAMLAFSPEPVQTAYIKKRNLEKRTAQTIVTKAALKAELQGIKQRGYAVDDEEWAIGVRCVAVPVFDHNDISAYALSAAGPVQRMTDRVIKEIKNDLLAAADELSSSIGCDLIRHQPGGPQKRSKPEKAMSRSSGSWLGKERGYEESDHSYAAGEKKK